MKCEYCKKELPKIISGRRDICGCDKANREWNLSLEIQSTKKKLFELNKELKELKEGKENDN